MLIPRIQVTLRHQITISHCGDSLNGAGKIISYVCRTLELSEAIMLQPGRRK